MEITVPINYTAVLVAALASVVLGFLWYGPLFGQFWMKLSGMKMPKTMTPEMKVSMMRSYGLTFVGSLVMAYVLAHSLTFAAAYLKVEGLSAGFMSGFWSWLGFVAPVTMSDVLWGTKPWKLWVLNNGYNLLALLAMGAILGMWK